MARTSRKNPVATVAKPEKIEISTGAAVLIMAGVVTALGLYVMDLISMLGG